MMEKLQYNTLPLGRCKTCEETKLASNFYRAGQYGFLKNVCCDCVSKRKRGNGKVSCRSCGTTAFERFYKSDPWLCKRCHIAQQKVYQAQNPVRVAKQKHATYLRRKERVVEESRRWQRANPERNRSNQRKWKERNRVECSRKAREYVSMPEVQIRRRLHNYSERTLGIPLGKTTKKQQRLLLYRRLFVLVTQGRFSSQEAQTKIERFDEDPLNILLSVTKDTCYSGKLYNLKGVRNE